MASSFKISKSPFYYSQTPGRRDAVEDEMDDYFRKQDVCTDVAHRVHDLTHMTFNQALTKVLGVDVDLVKKKYDDLEMFNTEINYELTGDSAPGPSYRINNERMDGAVEQNNSDDLNSEHRPPTPAFNVSVDGCPVCEVHGLPMGALSKHYHTTYFNENEELSALANQCYEKNFSNGPQEGPWYPYNDFPWFSTNHNMF